MRIAIDMQGAQSTGSWNRGIGRYTTSLALALLRHRKQHEVLLALSGAFPESIERIRAAFQGILPQNQIRVWTAPTPSAHIPPGNTGRRHTAELVREAFLASLKPDVVVVSSLFEGLVDNAVTSIKHLPAQYLTAVILYDLIPYIYRQPYLENPAVEAWYLEKIEHLKRADLWLGISESSRCEGVEHLGLPAARSVNISTAADEHFQTAALTKAAEAKVRKAYGLYGGFVMYTGGIDHRKNIEGLIRAYAKLPTGLRNTHQLAIVCSIQDDSRNRLQVLASNVGLQDGELVLTGFVPEDDLIALYNLCAVFVFPSWHEGFGLPALEAMRCGAPVIAANTSSLPEVVGLDSALFDTHSDAAIAAAIERVLTDEAFRANLIAHGKRQASKFSWDETAKRALAAIERCASEQAKSGVVQSTRPIRPRLAYVSPLPPERSGIADYSAELLPALAPHYDIEVVVSQGSVSDAWIKANCPIRSAQWLTENGDQFDRVIYHFGNSAFHQHMFGLLKLVPGVVVLHDFYLSGVLHYMDATGYEPGCFKAQLYESHGYPSLVDHAKSHDIAEVIWQYPCCYEIILNSLGTIVHSENSLRLAQRWYQNADRSRWSVIPLMRACAPKSNFNSIRKTLGFSDQAILVCSFGMMGPTKLNHHLLNAWFCLDISQSPECYLIFVGENHPGDYGRELEDTIKRHPRGATVRITGWADQNTYRNYLSVADIGVQLRTLSRGETSGAVLDCMNYGLATIVNANGSMADLDADAVWLLPDVFDVQEMTTALETLCQDRSRREQLGSRAKSIIVDKHDPAHCAQQYHESIERFYNQNKCELTQSIVTIAHSAKWADEAQLMGLAADMAVTFSKAKSIKTLFIDISELVQRDAKSGIQRVVRNIVSNWFLEPPDGWRIEPVYATPTAPYRFARQFTQNLLGITKVKLIDEPIDFASGDIFLALDLCPQIHIDQADFYQYLRNRGVTVNFLVYDLLCIKHPQHFVPGAAEMFSNWLNVVGECDGAVCISKAVAVELTDWMETRSWKRQRGFSIDYFHLGADFFDSSPSKGPPAPAASLLDELNNSCTFLMVGTLEPRKGHAQVLDAFEYLWQSDTDVNLVIVGKQGWMVEDLVARLRSHSKLNKRFFWLEGISDEYLEKVYAASTCLIAASYGEGFGLPLIEAAQHKLPIIARDIPVFREVAGPYAYYFEATQPDELATAIKDWIILHRDCSHPQSDGMYWLTWKASAKHLLTLVTAAGNREFT